MQVRTPELDVLQANLASLTLVVQGQAASREGKNVQQFF